MADQEYSAEPQVLVDEFTEVGGRVESPSPRMSGAITKYRSARPGMTLRHMYQVCGQPCSRTTGSPAPELT
jgi:hypothetical protein